jgi:hypothetical protein
VGQAARPSAEEVAEFRRIIVERDFPAFAETYLRIQTKTEGLQPFVLWPVQRELWDRRTKEGISRSLVLKYRQGGFSKLELAISFFFAICNPDVNVLVMGHEKALPTEMLDVVRIFIEFMPEWARPVVARDSESEIYFGDLRSSIRVGSGATVMEGAGAKLGRTIQRLHVTEAADPRWRDDALNMLFQTVPLECEIVVESTAKGARGWFYDECQLALAERSTFELFFYEWWLHPEYRRRPPGGFEPNERERWLMENKGLTLEQAAFRRWKIAELRDEKAFLELYPEDINTTFILSGAGYFDTESLRYQLETPGCVAGADGVRGRIRRDSGSIAAF